MSELTREDLQYHCRTCLAKLSSEVYFPKIDYLSEWIYNFASIDVRNESSEYPKFVCAQCHDIFKCLDDFHQLVRHTEKRLAGVLRKHDNIDFSVEDQRLSLKRKLCCEPGSKSKRVTISDDEKNSNEVVGESESEAIKTENVFELNFVDSKLKETSLEHSTQVPDTNEEMVIKLEIPDEDSNEVDAKKDEKWMEQESNRNKTSNTLNEQNLEHSRQVLENQINGNVIIKTEVTHDEVCSKNYNSTTSGVNKKNEALKLNGSNLEHKTQVADGNIDVICGVKTEVPSEDENSNDVAVKKESLNLDCSIQHSSNNIDGIVLQTDKSNNDFNKKDNKSHVTTPEENSNAFEIEILDTDSVSGFDIKFITELNDESADDEYSCEICNFYYDNKYNCMAHKRLIHGFGTKRKGHKYRRGYKCEICPRSYFKFLYLDKHMREIHKIFVRPYQCEYTKCGCRFRDWPQRIKHYHEYHQQIKAERLTSSFEILKNERNLCICIVCNKQYKSLNYIRFHMPTHGDDLKLHCGICGVRHSSQKKLNYHYDKYHDSKYRNLNRCKICHKLFSTIDKTEEHILLQHKRIFTCQFCPRRFRTKHGLLFHQPIHYRKHFPCHLCHTYYQTFEAFKCHIRVEHRQITALDES